MNMDKTTRSAQIFERALKVMPGGNTRFTTFFPPFPPYAYDTIRHWFWGFRVLGLLVSKETTQRVKYRSSILYPLSSFFYPILIRRFQILIPIRRFQNITVYCLGLGSLLIFFTFFSLFRYPIHFAFCFFAFLRDGLYGGYISF